MFGFAALGQQAALTEQAIEEGADADGLVVTMTRALIATLRAIASSERRRRVRGRNYCRTLLQFISLIFAPTIWPGAPAAKCQLLTVCPQKRTGCKRTNFGRRRAVTLRARYRHLPVQKPTVSYRTSSSRL